LLTGKEFFMVTESQLPTDYLSFMAITQHPYRYLLAFGSNLGDREAHCRRGLDVLATVLTIRHSSPWVYTPALISPLYDCSDHGEYLNFVIDSATALGPEQLYQEIVAIEDRIGHDRQSKWRPRQLDIDILAWSDNDAALFVSCSPRRWYGELSQLQIPHPELQQRTFLLEAIASLF
jgi:2-amino-4-hydroxy-6-hydroxymethyldihydropteridine diphosphokinase